MRGWTIRLLKRMLSRQILIYSNGCDNRISLTFDDGPFPEHTESILRVLGEYSARATFFLVGQEADKYPKLVKAIADNGHEIGNHFYNHHRVSSWDWKLTIDEIQAADTSIKRITGKIPSLIRPPYGAVTPALLLYAWRERRSVAMWSYDSRDSYSSSTEEIMESFRPAVFRGGDILLFHEDCTHTVRVLPEILASLRRLPHKLDALSVQEPDLT